MILYRVLMQTVQIITTFTFWAFLYQECTWFSSCQFVRLHSSLFFLSLLKIVLLPQLPFSQWADCFSPVHDHRKTLIFVWKLLWPRATLFKLIKCLHLYGSVCVYRVNAFICLHAEKKTFFDNDPLVLGKINRDTAKPLTWAIN